MVSWKKILTTTTTMIILCMYRNEKKKNFEIRIFTFFCENKKKKTKFNDDNFGIEKKKRIFTTFYWNKFRLEC